MVNMSGQFGLYVSAPSSSAITNAGGTAVILTVDPYTEAKVQVDTRSLPPNVRLDTATLDLGPTHVVTRRIKATEMRQLQLQLTRRRRERVCADIGPPCA
nr:fimbria/pilus outer membrane usher protein [Burkholderia ubonensis]